MQISDCDSVIEEELSHKKLRMQITDSFTMCYGVPQISAGGADCRGADLESKTENFITRVNMLYGPD